LASAGGSARLKILHKRKVRGWLAAVVTVTDAAKASQLGPLGVATTAGITEATVPETVKDFYELDKLSAEGKGNRYVLRDGRGEALTENDFVRRFRRVTGSDELDDVERRRNPTITYVTGGLTALSAGALAWGLLNLSRGCSVNDGDAYVSCPAQSAQVGGVATEPVRYDRTATGEYPPGIIVAVTGGLATAGFGTWFLINLLRPDGSDTDHLITDLDAVLYTNRDNRSLLRKTVKEVERVHSTESRVEPRL
jgi:hypothetical protein